MAPRFSMDGYVIDATVVAVYDGDTFTAEFPIPQIGGSPVYKWSCRVQGIDTPEMRDKDPELKALAYKARDRVHEMLLDKQCRIILGEFDKYGRVLATPLDPISGTGIGGILIDEGLALAYDGGTKTSWKEELEKRT